MTLGELLRLPRHIPQAWMIEALREQERTRDPQVCYLGIDDEYANFESFKKEKVCPK